MDVETTVERGADSASDVSPWSAAFVIFCLYTFVMVGRPQDYLLFLAPIRPALVLTILMSFVTVFTGFGKPGAWRTKEAKLYVAFFAILCAGIPASIYRRASFEFVILGYVTNVAYFLLFLVHVNTIERLKRIVLVVVLGTLAFNLVWFGGGGFAAGRYFGGGSMFDPNDTAFVEVSLLSFGLCVVLGRYSRLAKVLSFVSIVLSFLLTLFSGSRGGAVALAAWVLLFLGIKVANVSKLRKLIVVAAGVGLAFLNADKINIDRYMTLLSLQDDYNVSDEWGRTDIWKRGLQVLGERPLTGVGADCFAEAIGMERERLGAVGKRQAAHNSYVQVATESGVFGALAFFALIGACVLNFNRLRRGPAESERELAAHSTLFLISFVAALVCGMFLAQAYSTTFTLYFAVSGAARALGSTAAPTVPAAAAGGGS